MDCTVRNANYERVVGIIEKFVGERGRSVCSCPRCLNDIAAIALNYLPPHYYADLNEGKETGSPWMMVETAVAEAIERVSEYPNHPHQPRHQERSSGSPDLTRKDSKDFLDSRRGNDV